MESNMKLDETFVPSSILSNYVHNSELGINKLIPDILYDIFTFAVYGSTSPDSEQIVLKISSICRHWRTSALGWPVLWASINLRSHPSLIDLFLERSRNSPLMLSWVRAYQSDPGFDELPSKSFFVSRANLFLPRLSSLGISTPYADFIQFVQVIQQSGLLPLQLQYLDIRLVNDHRDEDRMVPSLTHLIDNSCLREIKLRGLDLPWLELPYNNKLTHLILIDMINPPALSQLLLILSNSPFLKVLELDFFEEMETALAVTTPTCPLPIDKLALNLDTLKLRADGPENCDFVKQISHHIRTPGALSCFELVYITTKPDSSPSPWGTNQETDVTSSVTSSCQLFEAIPHGTLSHFSNQTFLDISLSESASCIEISGSHTSGYHVNSFNCRAGSFRIYYEGQQIDHSHILELVRGMSHIQYLTLQDEAWEIFASRDLDIRSMLPRLHTLKLAARCSTQGLHSLLPAKLRVRRLILEFMTVSFPEGFLYVLSGRGIKVLELNNCLDVESDECEEIFSILRKRGMNVEVNSSFW